MRALEFITYLRTQGRYFFTIQEAEIALSLNKIATINAIRRLRLKNLVASPARGFYVIVPPEYQVLGCLPADMFISDLMKYLELPYYVGFLSAAQYFGAAHQKPQVFQIVTSKNREAFKCGKVGVEFITNKYASQIPFKEFNSQAGVLKVATPEAIAKDIITMPQYAAGISNVATVLIELAEQINVNKIIQLMNINSELFWVQRLGYLFDFLNLNKLSAELYKHVKTKKLHWVRLVAKAPYKPLSRNKKWKIIVNTNVEPDE